MFTVSNDTPLAALTVGQFLQLLSSAQNGGSPEEKVTEEPKSDKRYVKGIAGIATLFGVSYVTAHKLKAGVLKPAVYQQGRTIITDVEKAMELFNKNAEDNKI